MNKELVALKDAMDAMDFDKARDIATAYVNTHLAEFAEYTANADAAETEQQAVEQVVKLIEAHRDAGMLESQYRAEAWHLHTWDPQQIGASVGPQRRQPFAAAAPLRRVHK